MSRNACAAMVLALCAAGVQANGQAFSSPGSSGDPITLIAPSTPGHMLATHASGATDDLVPTVTGDAAGPATGTVVAVQRPGYTNAAVTNGATVQLPPGYSYYDLTGSGLVAAATIRLPANPQDKQLARLITVGTLQVTILAVQDASGNAVGSTLGLGLLSSALYQFQGAAWVRVGN